jgi:alpha-galactosidase
MSLDAFTRNLLTNDEVIAVDQDELGHAAKKVWEKDGWEIWARKLADGREVVGIFNFKDSYRGLLLLDLVPQLSQGTLLRDLWRQKDLGSLSAKFQARVPAHGVLLLAMGEPHR